MRERLYIAEDESIPEIASKLTSFPGEELILVAPQGAVIFESLENLAFLKDTAAKLGSRLAIETEDPRGQRLAASLGLIPGAPSAAVGLPVYDIVPPISSTAGFGEVEPHRSIPETQKPSLTAPAAELSTPKHEEEHRRVIAPAIEPTSLRPWSLRTGIRRAIWVSLLLSVMGGIVGVHLSLSRATLAVKLRRQTLPFSETVLVRADTTKVNNERRVLPGESLEFRETIEMTFRASQKQMVRERARGQVRVVNAFSSSPQTIVAGTRFAAPDGKIFRIERRLIVPGARVEAGKIQPSSIAVELVADEPGEAGNAKVSTRFAIPGFSGTPKFEGFWAEAIADFSGGFVGEVLVVRSQDIAAAEASIQSELASKLEEHLARKPASGLTLIDAAKVIDIPRATSSVEAGGWAETFTLSAEGMLAVLAFRQEDLTSLLSMILIKDSATLSPSASFPPPRFELTSMTGRWDRPSNVLELDVRGLASVPERFDAGLFGERLLGKREREVREVVVSTPAIEQAELKLTPFWRKSVPHDPSRLTIRLE